MESFALMLLAVLLANLPFVSRRFFTKQVEKKKIWMEIVEFLSYYLVLNVVSYFLEVRSGPFHPKDWIFYVVTLSFFLILSFPSFTYRYFWR